MTRNAATRRAEHGKFAAYREWLGALPATCVVSGEPAADLCHIRHFTGMAIKPPPCHCLPMARRFHTRQETLGLLFFQNIGIADAIMEAEVLWAIYRARDEISAAQWATARLMAIQAQVNQEKVKMLMAGVKV